MREGKEESFQYGMDSKFSANLQAIVEQYGDKAVLELGHILKARQADSEVVEEALLQLGMIDDSATQRTRLSILEESLKSDSVGRRDAAGLGIASMNDPSALPALRRALKRETSSRLKHDLHLVVEQLEQTQRCHDS
jgi:HEAT repeat protein